ncbi:RNA polymerase sigma factor [Dyadobacter fermentans]|uniref:RNA polymerase, sigma-24 subunit, ECF subfamily n=1 Tax=Dyadobacter fermentans (strain ATCC 700827 / DSM 18053 / CIP 107007 / KCTC 52180 / NS114) TaxID=471854 RepID=C6VUS3_DYAFD|nr:RNA polymerase sigma factor [Dyadobacter fermentans]ACT93060.1 RNA polymerase, sigma-24 subunit, ECF subfamily [Dyadobacter fermentans DSM 18053]
MKLFKWRGYASLTQLVEGCQREERRAQNVFYERYKNSLKGVCVRYARTDAEADDILQESFIRIFKNIQNIKQPESVDRWVKSVVIRTAINYYHQTTKRELLHSSIENSENLIGIDESFRVIEQLDFELLLGVIKSLPDGYRTVINLYLIDGYTHAEIANILSIAEGTSKSQLQRGRTLLIKKLQESGIEYDEFAGRRS